MKAFSQLSTRELWSLKDDEFLDSVKLEAAAHGFAIPLPVAKIAHRVAYSQPAGAIPVYCITDSSDPRFGYRTHAEAVTALDGLVRLEPIHDRSYRRVGTKITPINDEICIRTVYVGDITRLESSIPTDDTDYSAYEKLLESCKAAHSAAVNTLHTSRRNEVARVEFLRLANGDKTVANNFWRSRYGSEMPEPFVEEDVK